MVKDVRLEKKYAAGVIGVLWIIDGILQLQPQMFTRGFADQVLAPSAVNQPGLISAPMYLAIKIILTHPAVFNLFFGLAQLIIGALVLYKGTRRYGLIASVIWGLSIWVFGEGLGGIFVPGNLLLTGAPGAALLYAICSLALLGKKNGDGFPFWMSYAWAGLWFLGIVLIFYGNMDAKGLAAAIVSSNATAPHWLYMSAYSFANYVYSLGFWLVLITVLLFTFTGLMVFFGRRLRKVAVALGIVLALVIWVFGENFGHVYSGIATDIGSGPLIVLLGLMVLSSPALSLDIL